MSLSPNPSMTNRPFQLERLGVESQHLHRAYLGLFSLAHTALTEVSNWRKNRAVDESQAQFCDTTEWNLIEDRAKFLLNELTDFENPYTKKNREGEESLREGMKFGRHMREFRLSQKWSLKDMADILHWAVQDVISMELGLKMPDTNRMEVIKELLT